MPDRIKDRVLTVDDRDYLLLGSALPQLFEDRIIYECGGNHDLHLDPAGLHGAESVARLLRAIRGFRRHQPDSAMEVGNGREDNGGE